MGNKSQDDAFLAAVKVVIFIGALVWGLILILYLIFQMKRG